MMAKCAAGFLIFRRLSSQIEYLLLKASYGDLHWSPPKGHVDPGEDGYTTALRETQEEAGYSESDLKIYKSESMTLNYDVKGNAKTVVYWLAELQNPQNDPKLSDEHTEYCWLPKEQSIDLLKYDNYKNLIEFFHERIINEKLEN